MYTIVYKVVPAVAFGVLSSLLFFSVVPFVLAQSDEPLLQINQVTGTNASLLCTDNFALDKLTINVAEPQQESAPQPSVTYSGTITNGNVQTIQASTLYGRLYRVDTNGVFYLIETKKVVENFVIPGSGTYSFTDKWQLPVNLAAGSYFTEYALAPLNTGIAAVGSSPRFSFTSTAEPVTIMPRTQTINGVPALEFDRTTLEPGDNITVGVTLQNNSSTAKTVPIEWAVSEGLVPAIDNAADENTDIVSIPANSTEVATYEFVVPEAQEFLVGVTVDDGGILSSLEQPIIRRVPVPMVLVGGIHPPVFQAGEQTELFYCIASQAAVFQTGFDLTFDLFDGAGTKLATHTFATPPTSVVPTLTLNAAASAITLRSTVISGITELQSREISYENTTSDTETTSAVNGLLTPRNLLLAGFGVLGILIIGVVLVRSRNKKITY